MIARGIQVFFWLKRNGARTIMVNNRNAKEMGSADNEERDKQDANKTKVKSMESDEDVSDEEEVAEVRVKKSKGTGKNKSSY